MFLYRPGYTSRSFKGGMFFNFLFASLTPDEERICTLGAKYFLFRVGPFQKRAQNRLTELSSQNVIIPLKSKLGAWDDNTYLVTKTIDVEIVYG